jgi:molybdopterin synthase catalytic subunit
LTKIQREDFDLAEEVKRCIGGRKNVGGVVTFTGIVRDFSHGKEIEKIELTHYSSMAEKQLEKLRLQAMEKFSIINLTISHRVGTLLPSDNIVCIVAAAHHRNEAFDACRFAIDELKKSVPIWKKEFIPGGESWVESL